MSVWGIDIGTHLGWGILGDGEAKAAGVQDLAGDPFDGFGMRPLRAGLLLDRLLAEHGAPSFVAIENVRRHLGTKAAHVWGAIAAAVTMWCEAHGVAYAGVEVGRAKLELTGGAVASKDGMLAAVRRMWSIEVTSEDAADALGIALAAWRVERGEATPTKAETAKREAAQRKLERAAAKITKGARRARKEAA